MLILNYLITNGPAYFATTSVDYRLGIPIVIVLGELRLISGGYLLFQLCYTLTMLFVLSSVLLTSVWVRFWQSRLILQRLLAKQTRLINFFLDRFMHTNRESVIRLVEANRFVGKLWYAFLLINYPISCFVIVQVMFLPMSPLLAYGNMMMFAYQLLFILTFHLCIVIINRRVTKPNKTLIHLALNRERQINRVNKMRLSLYLQTFHAKRKYGITYYKFGLVSLGSFTKVSVILYGCVCMCVLAF